MTFIVLLFIAHTYQKQHEKINNLALGISGLQSHVDENQFAAQVALLEIHDIGIKVKQCNECQPEDSIWGSGSKPIGSTAIH